MKTQKTAYWECEKAIKELIRRESAVKSKIKSAGDELDGIQRTKQDNLPSNPRQLKSDQKHKRGIDYGKSLLQRQ